MMAAEPKRAAGDDRVLPPDICTEILTRLPAKSILLCRSVCKSWFSLVSCPKFITRNLNKNRLLLITRNLNKNNNRLLDNRAHLRSFTCHDESLTESHEHNDFPEAFRRVRVVGSCNGLICLSKSKWVDGLSVVTTFVIWNPTIHKVVKLPSRTISPRVRRFTYYGFGFDFKTGDYKVMCTHSAHSDKHIVCEFYDLSKGVWRGITPLVHPWDFGDCTPECYLDGVVHWTRYRCIRIGICARVLLSFDMSDENFREISIPDYAKVWNEVEDNSAIETRSVTLNGLIHVIVWKTVRDDYAGYDTYEECSVWAMKEYGVAESWTRLFDIDLQSAELYQHARPDAFHLWENGEVLMQRYLPRSEYHYDEEDEDKEKDMEPRDILELVLYNTE